VILDGVSPLPAPLDRIVPTFVADLHATFGRELVGAYIYGSVVSGGFDPAISDLDLVVVTEQSTDDIDFDVFDGIVTRLAAREPDWADRLDITFVGRETLATFRSGGPLVEISHDVPLRRIASADDWLETWFLAREADTPLVGPPPGTLIPPIDIGEFLQGVALDVDRLVDKAREDPRDGSVAYRLLTLGRALRSLETGAICSKDEGAAWVSERSPAAAPVIELAQEVRRSAGSRALTTSERAAMLDLMTVLAEQIRRTGPPAVPGWRRPSGTNPMNRR
jgi:hypothetical protein